MLILVLKEEDFENNEEYEKKKKSLQEKLKRIRKEQKKAEDGKMDAQQLKAVLRKNLKKTLGDVEEAAESVSGCFQPG